MSLSPVLAATRPCTVPNSLVLHLSGASESEYEPISKPSAPAPRQPVIVNGKLLLNSKRIYQCTFDGCEKSYTKPSRLEEHERSHTGDVSFPYIYFCIVILKLKKKRPFVCTTCNKSYLRESHLQAHVRSHLSNSDRPFVCEESDCDKRFWTAQHLRAHKDVIHNGEKPFKVVVYSFFLLIITDKGVVHSRRVRRCISQTPQATSPSGR
jgi:general transcription factor IIIA